MLFTIAYLTNRREPMIQWFFDSLHRECSGIYDDIKVVVVDFYADYPGRRDEISKFAHSPLTHLPPAPNVWQGQYRLTTQDYFAASNARNTALCVAPDGYIVYVDDLSVLLPGWLTEVRAMASRNYIACGTYEKVLGLEVTNGEVTGYRDYPPGKDSRMKHTFTQDPVKCTGSWLFGASVAIPTEALLTINGFDTDNDSSGGEDYICGLMLEQNGFDLRFCPRMKTFESEERHHLEPPFKRIIKPGRKSGEPDASHQILRMVLGGTRRRAPNYCDYRAVRHSILYDNAPFPIIQIPQHDWRDQQPLAEM